MCAEKCLLQQTTALDYCVTHAVLDVATNFFKIETVYRNHRALEFKPRIKCFLAPGANLRKKTTLM